MSSIIVYCVWENTYLFVQILIMGCESKKIWGLKLLNCWCRVTKFSLKFICIWKDVLFRQLEQELQLHFYAHLILAGNYMFMISTTINYLIPLWI